MRDQFHLGSAGLRLELPDQLVEPREQLLLDHLYPHRVEPARTRDRSSRSGVVLERPHEAVRVTVLDEAHLLGLELRAGADVAVHEDDGIVASARMRGRRQCRGDAPDEDEYGEPDAAWRRSAQLQVPCQRQTRHSGQNVSNCMARDASKAPAMVSRTTKNPADQSGVRWLGSAPRGFIPIGLAKAKPSRGTPRAKPPRSESRASPLGTTMQLNVVPAQYHGALRTPAAQTQKIPGVRGLRAMELAGQLSNLAVSYSSVSSRSRGRQ